MNAITINDETIAKLEGVGFNRWTKYGKDRLYINPKALGMEVDYYKTGNIRHAEWEAIYEFNTESYVEYPVFRWNISNAEAGRILSGKYYFDLADGTVHVSTSSDFAEAIQALIWFTIDSTLAPTC